MHPRPERRWTMEQIRWWGGWIQSESNEVLMRYILEAHDRQQKYFGDSLDPYRHITAMNHPNNFPCGPSPQAAATVADIHTLEHKTQLLIQQLRTAMESHMQTLVTTLTTMSSVAPATVAVVAPPAAVPAVDLTTETDDEVAVINTIPAPVQILVDPRHKGKAPLIRGVKSLREALRQWTHADPPYHPYALKDWPSINPAWLKQRSVASKYNGRKLLYRGFTEACDSDLSVLYRRFGTSLTPALDNLRRHFGLQREGRKGMKYKSRPRPHKSSLEKTPEHLANGAPYQPSTEQEDPTDDEEEATEQEGDGHVRFESSMSFAAPTYPQQPRRRSSSVSSSTSEDSAAAEPEAITIEDSESEYGSPLSPGFVNAQVEAAEAAERTASQAQYAPPSSRRASLPPLPRRSHRPKANLRKV